MAGERVQPARLSARPRSDPRPRVVHLTGDFPDPIDPAKTDAIRRLIDLTADRFDHLVISINRRTPSAGAANAWLGRRVDVVEAPFDYGLVAEYRAPPAGLLHATMLERLGEWLAARLACEPLPALLVGHKLTIEGLAVRRASEQLGLPYALSIQGNTDERVLRARPDLVPRLREVLHGASAVFPFAPWAFAAIERRLGTPLVAPRILPCATPLDTPLDPRARGNGLITAFHLRNWRTKNFDRTVSALAHLNRAASQTTLAVVGGGTGLEADRCRRIGAGVPGVAFEGALAHSDMPRRLNAASALVLPSRRESFGMVFIEALFAGLPIIYPAGQAVDGYFDRAEFALRVDSHSAADIAGAMARALAEETRLKSALAEWQQGSEMARFQRAAIARQFADGLADAIARPVPL